MESSIIESDSNSWKILKSNIIDSNVTNFKVPESDSIYCEVLEALKTTTPRDAEDSNLTN